MFSEEFRKKSKSFKITAVVTAAIVLILTLISHALIPNISAESIRFPNTTIYLEENMTYRLTPQCDPYNTDKNNLVYRCSNTDIVKLKGNLLTALSTGCAYVYCYDRRSKVKSDVITVYVVESISSLIPNYEKENEEAYIKDSHMSAIYVYYAPNGTKYHTADCSLVGKNPRKTTLNNAVANGLTPCARCQP